MIKHTWRELSSKLENLLQEYHDPVIIPLQKQFELQVDFSSLNQQLENLPEDHIEKVVSTFKKLHHYFESGILLENTYQTYNAIAFFNKGHVRVAGEDFHKNKIKLPTTKHLQVLSTSSRVFTQKLGLNWDPEKKCKAYLIKPTPDFAFVLFSPVPDLWMQNEIPKMVAALGKMFPS